MGSYFKKKIGFRIDVLGFRVRISKKIRFRIDGLGFRVEFYGLEFEFRNSIIRKKLKKLSFVFLDFLFIYLFIYLLYIKRTRAKSLLPLNEDIFEYVSLVVVKMKSGSMTVVNIKFLQKCNTKFLCMFVCVCFVYNLMSIHGIFKVESYVYI